MQIFQGHENLAFVIQDFKVKENIADLGHRQKSPFKI